MTATSRTSSSRSPGDRRRPYDRPGAGAAHAALPRCAHPVEPDEDGGAESAASHLVAPLPPGDRVEPPGTHHDERRDPVTTRTGVGARAVPMFFDPMPWLRVAATFLPGV